MDILQVYVQLLDKPTVPKFYRQLQDAYRSQGRMHEAEAIGYLIEKRFGKKDDDKTDDSPGREEQPRDGGADA